MGLIYQDRLENHQNNTGRIYPPYTTCII